jgi:lipopolysaccharide export system ATP-binding protein
MSQGIRRSGLLNFFALLRQGYAPKRKQKPNGGWQDPDRASAGTRGLNPRDLAARNLSSNELNSFDLDRQSFDPRTMDVRDLDARDPAPRDLDAQQFDPRAVDPRNPDPRGFDPRDLDAQDWAARDPGAMDPGGTNYGAADYDAQDRRDIDRGAMDHGEIYRGDVDHAGKERPAVAARPEARKPKGKRPLPRREAPAVRREAAQGYLAAHGLEKSYGARRVVNGVSLYVRRGEAVGLLGPNGAGKTTAFYTITGLIKPERGKIELDGYDVTHLPMYQRARLGIGYLPQEASIFRGLNVEENIRAVLEVVEPDRRKRDADLNALLDEFEITARRKTPTIALSGGERRRVEIARALASRPNYMLLDEPFAGIDPKAVVEIQRLVRRLTQRGIGVLITDHNVRETLDLTDRSYIIYSGEVLMEGRKDDIVNDPQVRQLYLGEDFRI